MGRSRRQGEVQLESLRWHLKLSQGPTSAADPVPTVGAVYRRVLRRLALAILRTPVERDHHFDDFTEAEYRRILRAAKDRYAFEVYGTTNAGRHVLWRHDVDCSVHRALHLARLEADEGVTASYFLQLHSVFYNLLEEPVFSRVEEILTLGHQLGLHFDAGFYGGFGCEDELADKLAYERRLLMDLFDRRVDAFSLHDTQMWGSGRFDSDTIAGMTNTNGRDLMARYGYVSDSNGYWRFRRLPDVIAAAEEERLQVLTHPEWWQAEAASPRDRIRRCVEGRGRYIMGWYDDLLATQGRPNIGAPTDSEAGHQRSGSDPD